MLERACGGFLPAGEKFLVATGAHARRIEADLAELRELRLKAVGGSVFKRAGSAYWQIKYPVNGKVRYETTRTTDKREAERLLGWKVRQASDGLLPGTASFEQVLDHLLDDARARGLKSVGRMERAAKAMRARLEGYRAEHVDRGVWSKFVAQRLEQGAARDTVNFELSVARRAYRLAHESGMVATVPLFPKIKNLHVRRGFIEPSEWPALRAHLRPDFQDAAEFAFLCGTRTMETLGLTWSDVELDARVVHLTDTKTRRPRAIPYGSYPGLAKVIERRLAVRRSLEREGIISRWVFCFREPAVHRPAGMPLFKATGERGLCKSLQQEWRAAATAIGKPGLVFHDLRRSAARNFERAIPRGVAMTMAGWTPAMYSRYAIGAESDLAHELPELDRYLRAAGWQSGGTGKKSSAKAGRIDGDGGWSRTNDLRIMRPPL